MPMACPPPICTYTLYDLQFLAASKILTRQPVHPLILNPSSGLFHPHEHSFRKPRFHSRTNIGPRRREHRLRKPRHSLRLSLFRFTKLKCLPMQRSDHQPPFPSLIVCSCSPTRNADAINASDLVGGECLIGDDVCELVRSLAFKGFLREAVSHKRW